MMKRLLVIALVLALLPLMGLASLVALPQYGITVDFPANLDVFNKDMAMDDPVLALYGKTAQQARNELDSAGLEAMAYDIAGEFSVGLGISVNQPGSLYSMDEQGLRELALRYGGDKYELFTARNNVFLLVYGSNGSTLACVFLDGGILYELRLNANTPISPVMVNTLKNIAFGTDFALGQ